MDPLCFLFHSSMVFFFFFSSRRRHTRSLCDWSSDVCSSDLTGLVHTAPGHGHDDFVIGKAYGLDIYCAVDNAGRFTPEVEHFAGEGVFEANPRIVEFMRERGVLLFDEPYAHRYPHCWRCKNPVIFRATPQWFISLDARARETVEVERDEDGRDRSNFTENEGEAPESLRAMALREIRNVEWI